MKFGSSGFWTGVLAMFAVSATSALAIHPSVSVTPTYVGKVTVFPGSAYDFTLFGNPGTYPDNGNNGGDPIPAVSQPTVLDDLSVTAAGQNLWQGGSTYSTIIAPDGNSYATGLLYNGSPNNALATVTLTPGNTPSPGGFNYADFNLYVMFGNADNNGTNLSAITVTINGTTYTAAVTDETTDNGGDEVQVEEFNIQGLTENDTFTVGSVGNGGSTAYLGALSFESAPEPSTYAMMVAGLAVIALIWRMRGRALVG